MARGTGFRVDADDFRRLGESLREVENSKAVRKGLFRAIQRATRPVKKEIKASALAVLPARGGLNRWAASLTVSTKQSYRGNGAGVSIVGAKNRKRPGRKRQGTFGKAADMRQLNRGRVMHPTWGRGPLIGPQMITPGFFDKPLEGPLVDRMRDEIRQVLDDLFRTL